MIFQSPGSIAIDFGPISIHWYGIIIAAGIVLAYWYVISELKRRKIPQKPFDDMAFWVILSGVIGARLYYVIFNLSFFADKPLEIIQIWKGGLAIHGAILGGALAYTIFVMRKKIPWLLYADVIMPGVLLAQGLGRWGNFFNNEAFGGPTNLPWKLFIPEPYRPEAYADFSYFHPTFLYESLWNFLGFFILWRLSKIYTSYSLANTPSSILSRRHTPPGLIFFSYLIFYSIGRFFIEGLRTDSLYFGDLRVAQIMSILLFLGGIFGLIFLTKKVRIKQP